jgi:hypothetical protein
MHFNYRQKRYSVGATPYRSRYKIRNSSPNTSSKNDSGEKPEKAQKEKKKKDVSLGRQKKFYRHVSYTFFTFKVGLN